MLRRLSDAFPGDPGPDADAFRLKDPFDLFVPARFLEADWQEWPPHQRAAVEDVLLAWWQATLTEYPSTVPVDEVLAVVSQMTGDVEPWLTTWSTVGGVAAGRQLRDFVNAVLSWSYQIHDFDEEAAEQAIQRWLERDGVDIRFALAPGPELDTAFADLARRVTRGW